MLSYLARRLVISAATILGIVVIVFFIVRVIPGDAAALRAGPYASEEKIEAIRQQFGLADPIAVQFRNYATGVAKGDLGTSIRTTQPVAQEILERLPASLELAMYSVAIAMLLGIPIGIVAAAREGGWIDRTARVFAVIGSSMALFWLGLLFIFFLFFRLRWFPAPLGRLGVITKQPERVTGLLTVDGLLAGQTEVVIEALKYLALPSLTLGLVLAAPILKMVRASMLEALSSDHVRTARALGVGPFQILLRDGFRNALLPVTTAIGIVFGYMLGGNIIVEFLFSWPGVGRYAYTAIQNSDLEALQGFVIAVGILYVGLNALIDIAYAYIDPRIRLGKKVGS